MEKLRKGAVIYQLHISINERFDINTDQTTKNCDKNEIKRPNNIMKLDVNNPTMILDKKDVF